MDGASLPQRGLAVEGQHALKDLDRLELDESTVRRAGATESAAALPGGARDQRRWLLEGKRTYRGILLLCYCTHGKC
jgi:hypothetical protein